MIGRDADATGESAFPFVLGKHRVLPDAPRMNPYETEKLLREYLLFHYGQPEETLGEMFAGVDTVVLDYPARCVRELLDPSLLPTASNARALDLGCAVGRASFELARYCGSVVGIDFSERFIAAAHRLREDGVLEYDRTDEGSRVTKLRAVVPPEIDRRGLHFETGDATALRDSLGNFDIVLAANLLCRLRTPRQLLDRLPSLVKPGGQLILTTPCTWLEEFTPEKEWIGATAANGSTLDGLHHHLDAHFELRATKDLPFLIREHARKCQLSVALGTAWRRK